MKNLIEIRRDYNPVDYNAAYHLMLSRVEEIVAGKGNQLLWFLEHDNVYTAGVSCTDEEYEQILTKNAEVIRTDRGGKITYHGPGQRICYMLLDLRKREQGFDIRAFINDVHNVLINWAATFGILALRLEEYPGLWCRNKDGELVKLAAIGLKVKRGITFHGFAINISPDLSYYHDIVPCGITEYGITSMAELGVNISMEDVDKTLIQEMKRTFNFTDDN